MSSTGETASIKSLVFSDVERELATTRRVLERVPEDHFGWKPHENSFAIGALASHLANLPLWGIAILTMDEMDLAIPPSIPGAAATSAELVARWDDHAAQLNAAIAALDERALGRTWTMRRGEQVMISQPRLQVLRSMCLNHMIHHRGALSVNLRLLDVPVPSIYGPSADEAAGF
ncbi:MAG TPA: DinB family protein [Longimicrobiaceae bacterium]|nr:DinB family protein [Longimicrobiaceae bacterium]